MLEMRLAYPELGFRRYSVVFNNPHSKVFLPVESVFLGNILATPWPQLVDEFREWFRYEQNGKERGYIPWFEFNTRRYRVSVDEDGENRERVRELFAFKPEEVLEELLSRVESEYKARNLLRIGGDDAFGIKLGKYGKGKIAHTGDVVLRGFVKTKSHGGQGQKTKYERVKVTGPFEDSLIIYDDMLGQSEDYDEAAQKQGYAHVKLLDTNIAALLFYAKLHPEKIKGLEYVGDRTFFVPFYTVKGKRMPRVMDPHMVSGTQPPLMLLKWSVLMDHFFNGNNFYSIGRRLNEVQSLFHPTVIRKIRNGQAGFEGLASTYPFSREHLAEYSPPVQRFARSMLHALKRNGFRLNGYPIEKKFSEHEIGTIEFTNGDDIVRFLFSKQFPPVYIRRKASKTRVEVFGSPTEHAHPFAELFERKTVFDDKTRRDQPYEVAIPTDIPIPEEMWPDYRAAVQTHFPGGIEGLVTRLFERNIENRGAIIEMLEAA